MRALFFCSSDGKYLVLAVFVKACKKKAFFVNFQRSFVHLQLITRKNYYQPF